MVSIPPRRFGISAVIGKLRSLIRDYGFDFRNQNLYQDLNMGYFLLNLHL